MNFHQLYKHSEVKPFECVGTYDEINFALQKKIKQYNTKDNLPYLLKQYNTELLQNYNLDIDYKNNNNLPNQFKKILKSNVKQLNI